MLKLNTGITPEVYTCKKDQEEDGSPKEGAPQFLIRPLTGPEFLRAQDECYDPIKKTVTGAGFTQICKWAMTGWKNIGDRSQNPLEFSGPKDVDLLDGARISEIAARIISISDFTGEDAKNS